MFLFIIKKLTSDFVQILYQKRPQVNKTTRPQVFFEGMSGKESKKETHQI